MNQHRYILTTSRLRLREFTENDIDNLMLINSDPQVMQYFSNTLDHAENGALLQQILARNKRDGTSFWAAELLQTSEFIGMIGLLQQTIDDAEELEIAYRVARKHWGQGYATEAALGCKEYAFNQLARDRVISLIRPVNIPSIRVAEKVGMKLEKMIMFHGFEHRVYCVEQDTRI